MFLLGNDYTAGGMVYRIIVVLLLIFCGQVFCFRFICNGVLANGEERSDACGACDSEHAARWNNPNIPVVVDEGSLPEGLSLEDWRDVVDESFRAWESVSGAAIRFLDIDAENLRQFGSNETLHEIFWITGEEEWRELVGAASFGTLGATLPRYICGGRNGSKRAIFDADLVLNGIANDINWQLDCDNEDCISIQTTLVHELGHFFGLDHPCLQCSTSIMSARAGYDLMYPLFDDMEGVRELYPSVTTGEFGYACRNDDDCNAKKTCISEGDNRYCSTECDGDGDCDMGAVCKSLDGQNFCVFVAGDGALGRGLGESCTRVACQEPLICAGITQEKSYCFAPCQTSDNCPIEQVCHRADPEHSLCIAIKDVGETCSGKELCNRGSFCVTNGEERGFCRKQCDPEQEVFKQCPQGLFCHAYDANTNACIPNNSAIDLGPDLGSEVVATIPNSDIGREGTVNGDGNSSCQSVRGGTLWILSLMAGWLCLVRFKKRVTMQ